MKNFRKDFLSVKKFNKYWIMMIKKDLKGYLFIDSKVYLNQIINWLFQ